MRSAISAAVAVRCTDMPGSPWWPMPTSMLPRSIWKLALPTAGMVHADRPMPMLRVRAMRSEEHTSELQSQSNIVCRLLLEKKKKKNVNRYGNITNTAILYQTTHNTHNVPTHDGSACVRT